METLLNTKQAAARMGMSPRFLELKRINGGGPRFLKLSGRAVRYRESELELWLADKIRVSTAQESASQ